MSTTERLYKEYMKTHHPTRSGKQKTPTTSKPSVNIVAAQKRENLPSAGHGMTTLTPKQQYLAPSGHGKGSETASTTLKQSPAAQPLQHGKGASKTSSGASRCKEGRLSASHHARSNKGPAVIPDSEKLPVKPIPKSANQTSCAPDGRLISEGEWEVLETFPDYLAGITSGRAYAIRKRQPAVKSPSGVPQGQGNLSSADQLKVGQCEMTTGIRLTPNTTARRTSTSTLNTLSEPGAPVASACHSVVPQDQSTVMTTVVINPISVTRTSTLDPKASPGTVGQSTSVAQPVSAKNPIPAHGEAQSSPARRATPPARGTESPSTGERLNMHSSQTVKADGPPATCTDTTSVPCRKPPRTIVPVSSLAQERLSTSLSLPRTKTNGAEALVRSVSMSTLGHASTPTFKQSNGQEHEAPAVRPLTDVHSPVGTVSGAKRETSIPSTSTPPSGASTPKKVGNIYDAIADEYPAMGASMILKP